MRPLSERRRKFVNEYVRTGNGAASYAAAGYGGNPATMAQRAYDLLQMPNVKAAVEERKAELAAAAELSPEWVVKRWMEIATADPNEVVNVRRVCCRHCHGVGHRYQWTQAEYLAAVNGAVAAGKAAPDGLGGFGYDPKAEPHPECPECGGEGFPDVSVADTRRLKGSARRLYAGAERTKTGIKVHLRDQDKALDNIARFLGLYKDNVNLSGQIGFKPLSAFYGESNATGEDGGQPVNPYPDSGGTSPADA